MKYKKPLMVAAAVGTVGLASLGAVVSAQTAGTTPQSSLIDKIAQKFNLKKEDVKAVFDQDHAEREATMQKNVEDELTQAVKDKKITEEQKQKILAKRKELQAQRAADRDNFKDKTEAERHAAMEQKRTELEQWAKDNNIPTDYLRYVMGHGGPGHMGPPPGGADVNQ